MDAGDRLAAQSRWLRLLLAHLAGPALRARVEVDDLAQDVFVRALAGDLPEGEAALRRVLARVARSVVIDALRALRAAKRDGRREVRLVRTGTGSASGAWSAVAADTAGPATRAAAAEEERRLYDAFARLEGEHRRVIGLRQFEGLSAAVTAVRMGRSETAVHSLYRRALEAWEREGRRA